MSAPLALDLEGPVTDGFRTVMTFIPKLLGFLVILVVGYVIAKVVAKLVDKGLEKAGFDRAVERGGIKKALAKSQYDASDIVAKLVFFAIFIPFLSAAVGALGINALQQPLAQFIALIPRILVAIVLVVVGAVLAGAVKSFVQNTLGGLSYGNALATAASALVLISFVKSALDQVGVATTVTTPLLYTVLATVAGVTIVGAGGGLIEPMRHRWENVLNKAETETQQVRAQAEQRRAQAAQYGDEAYPQEPQYAPQYGEPQYGDPQYVPQYGEPQYSEPQYSEPQYGDAQPRTRSYPVDPAPAPTPTPRKRTRKP
ncbi:MAG: Conserved helix repeat-containing protein [Frankiales bacterium]|nr:Conserved helix repeat-containing protein [Frankiales bacterium]